MSVIEIVLIIIGAGVFLLGYLLPAGKKDADEEVTGGGRDRNGQGESLRYCG